MLNGAAVPAAFVALRGTTVIAADVPLVFAADLFINCTGVAAVAVATPSTMTLMTSTVFVADPGSIAISVADAATEIADIEAR
jgi:hypothetical protein